VPHLSLDSLAREFAFEKIGRAPAHFDVAELEALNTRLLHALPFDMVASRLKALGIEGSAAFWEAARPNLKTFADVVEIWRVVEGPITPAIEDADLVRKAIDGLPEEPWDESTWSGWTAAVSAATGAKGRALFHPLRLALTGTDHGPEMKKLLPLIGRAKTSARLRGETA
jgi:glutamyl-tRNA synthetase